MAVRIPTVRDVETWRAGSVEQLHDRVYDRYTMAAALGDLDLFNSPISSTRQGAQLTIADTNVRASQIPINEAWVLHGMGFRYQAIAARDDATVQNILDYLRDVVYTIKINGKDVILQLTGDQFLGPLVLLHQPAATIESKIAMGTFYGFLKFAVPIGLEKQTNWVVEMEAVTLSNAALNGDKIRLYFDRELLRLS